MREPVRAGAGDGVRGGRAPGAVRVARRALLPARQGGAAPRRQGLSSARYQLNYQICIPGALYVCA